MGKLVLLLVMLVFFEIGFGQNNKNQEFDMVSHTVQMGETIRMLSKKYLVDPSEIYKLNKFAVDGIKAGMVLQIPVPRKEPVIRRGEPLTDAPQEVKTEDPIVQDTPQNKPLKKPKAKVATTEIRPDKENAAVIEPIAAAPVEKQQSETVINRDVATEHSVVPGETVYSLSRKYGISVGAIHNANGDALKKGLKVGQLVKIPSVGNAASSTSTAVKIDNVAPDTAPTNDRTNSKASSAIIPSAASTIESAVTHKVGPKETLYSLSKKYGISVDEIKNQNPEVAKHGLKIGQTLTITKN